MTCLRFSSRCTPASPAPRSADGRVCSRGVERRLQAPSFMPSGKGQDRPAPSTRFNVSRTVEAPCQAGGRSRASNTDGKLQPNNLARIAHRNPLRWHHPPLDCQRGDLIRPTAAPANPDPGRDHSVMGGAIISEWGAASFRYGGRHHLDLRGGFLRNQHLKTEDTRPIPRFARTRR